MSQRASGTFEVKMEKQEALDSAEGASLGRLLLNKVFSGDLQATSSGQMLSAMGTVQGSAGYVAIERVVGSLAGRAGGFVLQHSGTMTRGQPSLTVTVVPDSGTGALAGIAGTLTIDIVDKVHFYKLDYTLPDAG